MAEINRKASELLKGVLNVGSGENAVIEMTRKGVIRGLNNSIKVKRPNQYKK